MHIEIEDEDLHKIRRFFSTFDEDGSGSITTNDLMDMFRELGQTLSKEDLIKSMREIDLNEDGFITFHEFLSIYKNRVLFREYENHIKEAFRVCDCDENGYVTIDELKKIMLEVGESLNREQLQSLFTEADLNNDAKINMAEFIELMKKQL